MADVFQELPTNKKREQWLASSKRLSFARKKSGINMIRSRSGSRQSLDASVLCSPRVVKDHRESVQRFLNVRRRHYLVNVTDFALSHVESHLGLDDGVTIFGRKQLKHLPFHVVRGDGMRQFHAAIIVDDSMVVIVPMNGQVTLDGKTIVTVSHSTHDSSVLTLSI